jgi:hypothetical protein
MQRKSLKVRQIGFVKLLALGLESRWLMTIVGFCSCEGVAIDEFLSMANSAQDSKASHAGRLDLCACERSAGLSSIG